MPLLSVQDMQTFFHTREGIVRAVNGMSYDIEEGETLAIVGESGSGKSVSCYSLLGLIPQPPGKIEGGTAMFDGIDLLNISPAEQRKIRGKRISMIFQDPMTALNPYMSIGAQLAEPLRIHEGLSKREALGRAVKSLESVGIQDAPKRLRDYPHQFSGGMRQRVMIAMALITKPQLLIADEPTTALDVTVQAQILDLIKRLQADLGMAVLLITHDLGIVAGFCDRVMVMYAGKICEAATADSLFRQHRHPYTGALMDSLPSAHHRGEALFTIPGMPPDLRTVAKGCPFAPRCEHVGDLCTSSTPELITLEQQHATSCLRVQNNEL